ncbi:uncharacterized protein LOC131931727 [Physella acuta]|uniref:uncharacterized protein LOC131931727 n=1 Tax=Physella acuta TaxID=109671 RepID=UPI0027DC1D11|nr:uncharacterized protein LOC131931727 [Physella acuta]
MSTRIEQLTMSEDKKSRAVRCLFPIDKEKLNFHLEMQDKEITRTETERFKASWGFDPESDCTVPGGKFECLPFSPGEYVPAFYTKSYSQRHITHSTTRSDNRRLKPFSAKRKLNLDEQENIVDNKVVCLEVVKSKECESRLGSPVEPDSFGRTSIPRLLPASSPSSDVRVQQTIYVTPTQSQQCQKKMTDYLPNKKKQALNNKDPQR